MLSPYIIVIIASWIVAQGAKYIAAVATTRDIKSFRHLYLSGNMPSAHSATVVSLATMVGLRDGFDTALFGIAALFAGIVMYDAVMVRRSVGEQGGAIQSLIQMSKLDVALPRAAKGHKPLEVLVGAIVGLAIGVVVFIATR